MKKIYSAFYALLIISALFIASCEKEDYTGYSTLTAVENVNVSLTWDEAPPATLVEGGQSFPFTLTLDKKQVVDVHVHVIQSGGDADHDDYSVTEELVIPAYATSASGVLTINKDKVIESTETLIIQIGDVRTANANFTPQTITIGIENYIYPSLNLTFEWDGNVVRTDTVFQVPGPAIIHTDTVTFCNNIDLDFYVWDADSLDLGIYDAATPTACPETLELDGWEDGDYYIAANLYKSSLTNPLGVAHFPVTTTVEQYGKSKYVFTQGESSFTSDSPADGSLFTKILKITVSGTNYTVTPL